MESVANMAFHTRKMLVVLGAVLLAALATAQVQDGSASAQAPVAARGNNTEQALSRQVQTGLGPNSCPPAWAIVTSANVVGTINQLTGVAAVSANDVWAVGAYQDPNSAYIQTLIEHWNGSMWSIVSSPNVAGGDNVLFGVTAVSANDVWAVGDSLSGSVYQTLTEHWNGSTWSIVPSPTVAGVTNQLLDVAAVSTNDVWAVGSYDAPGPVRQTLIEHWNGSVWSIVSSPNVAGVSNYLNGISAVSTNNIWAIGSYYASPTGTLTLHWNGAVWSIASSPNVPSANNYLFDVAAVSTIDVWAVGYHAGSGSPAQTLAEHWDGSSWSIVSSPNVPGDPDRLVNVAAVSTNDVWAVGYFFDSINSIDQTLVEHWDGSAWSIVSSPNVPGSEQDNYLAGVAAVSANDVWAVGDYYDLAFGYQTLIERYLNDCQVATPTPSITNTPAITNTPTRTSTPTLSPTPCAGSYTTSTGVGTLVSGASLVPGSQCNTCTVPIPLPFPVQLYGTSYSQANASNKGNLQFISNSSDWHTTCSLPSPLLGPAMLLLWEDQFTTGVTGPCPSCGIYTLLSGSFPDRVFTIQWRTQLQVSSGLMANYELRLYEGSPSFDYVYGTVDDLGAGAAVAVQNTNPPQHTTFSCPPQSPITPGLLVHWSYQPCVVNTPTSTPTPCPGCPTATPTTCAINFSDVQQSDYFYQAVSYLFCHGVINGYADGTFRPYANTTRGQLSKIIVLAEGWPLDTTGGPHFIDVQTTNAFYAYIETAYHHNIISGYSDGTFRWGSNVTRGQLSKIIVLAENWPINTNGGPHFSDVAQGSTFYDYVETAFGRGIISGYGDGTFRPGANAIRAQISKIVYNAVTGP